VKDRVERSWQTIVTPYALTAIAVALAIPVRLVLDPLLGDKLAFVTVFPVIVVSAWYAGAGPALMATFLGSLAVAYFILEPRGSFAIAQREYQIGIFVNAVISIGCIALFASLHRARSKAEAKAWEAKLREQQLEHEASGRSIIEANLRASEEQFRAMFDLSAVGQTLADPTTLKLTRVNRKYCEITGYSEDELVGKTFVELTHPDDRERNSSGYEQLVRGEIPEFTSQKRYIRNDGRVIWVQVNISLVPAGPHRPLRTAAIIQDITASKELELSLRESEERFRGIFDQAAVGVGQTSLDRVIVNVNPGLCRMLGYTAEELVGAKVLDLSHPDEHAASAEAMRPLLEGETDCVAMERRFRHKQGHYIWTQTIASLIRDRDGRPSSVVAIVEDITERKRAEDAIQEGDRRKDEFLATLAHELRNPLAPICNSLHILRMAEGDATAHEPVIEMMERQINHMVRLVDDLLEVSRITRGKIELRVERVELAAVIRSAVESSRPLIEASGHRLAISLPTEPVLLTADPVRMSQVFANLLNNAAKYTDREGQIWLTAQIQRNEHSRAEVVVSVRDSGMGIAPEMLPRIFDMFTQTDRSRPRAQGGLGIGLTLVRKLTELHGGRVEAKSEGIGRGSEFVVRLPLIGAVRPSPPEPRGQPARPHVSFSPRRVLVVDDNRDAANSLGVLLGHLGLEPRVVYDGPSALEALATQQPHVVLLDLGMPGMDGYEVVRQARASSDNSNVVFIALTGWGQEEDRRKSKAAGFDHHLVKPVDITQLESLLSAVAADSPLGPPLKQRG
jgi:PAS domain S-box-containing protein